MLVLRLFDHMGQLMHSWVLSLFLPRCWCALRPTITFEVVAGPRVTFIAGHPRVLHLLWTGAQWPSGRPTSLLGIYNFLPLLHVGVFRILHTYCNCSKNAGFLRPLTLVIAGSGL